MSPENNQYRPGNKADVNPNVGQNKNVSERKKARMFYYFMRALTIAIASLVSTENINPKDFRYGATREEPSKQIPAIDEQPKPDVEAFQKKVVENPKNEIDQLIEKLDTIKYENHPALTHLDRAIFCMFFNEFLKGKEKQLEKLWEYMNREMTGGTLTKVPEEKLKNIFAAVISTKMEFSKSSFFTAEGFASGFLPGTEKEIVDKISSFLRNKKNTQDVRTGYTKVFKVIDRNSGLSKKIEGLFKDLIEAIKIELKNDAKSGTEQGKNEAKELLKILIDTLTVLEVKK
jgi:hypothetical protein